MNYCEIGSAKPSIEEWMQEAKKSEHAEKIGMYLIHNGVVRETAKQEIYHPGNEHRKVIGMSLSVDHIKARKCVEDGLALNGIFYLKAWIAEGNLRTGDDIMQVLIGGDCRPNCVEALNTVVGALKNQCVKEQELFE